MLLKVWEMFTIVLINGRNNWLILTERGKFSRWERKFPYVNESNFSGGLSSWDRTLFFWRKGQSVCSKLYF